MIQLSIKEARALSLDRQGLWSRRPESSKAAVLDTLLRLGYLQIDTISVAARSHHHILWSRIPGYDRNWLRELEENDRAIFEYWAHAAAYLPIEDYRFTLVRKRQIRLEGGHWYPRELKVMRFVYDRIKGEGPLMSKDFDKLEPDRIPQERIDWARDPVHRALRQLFMEGKIMVSGRRGFQKCYDLPERVLPAHVNTRYPSPKAYQEYLIRRDIEAHGLVQSGEMGYLIKGMSRPLSDRVGRMVSEGKLIEVAVEEMPDTVYYTLPDLLENFPELTAEPVLHLLNPFDNTIIQRKRVRNLFGFAYTLECYVPAAKRKVGYYSLPVLLGSRFIAQIDVKADRNAKRMIIRNFLPESDFPEPEMLAVPLKGLLTRFAAFNHCERIVREKGRSYASPVEKLLVLMEAKTEK